MVVLPILTTSFLHFSFKSWENVLFELGSKRFDFSCQVGILTNRTAALATTTPSALTTAACAGLATQATASIADVSRRDIAEIRIWRHFRWSAEIRL